MKFKRKKVVEVEAHYMTETYKNQIRSDKRFVPGWLLNSLFEEPNNKLSCQTDSGMVSIDLPSWFIQEPNKTGAYPVSLEYFEENFEAVE